MSTKCIKRSEISVVLIAVDGVLCEVRDYHVTVSYHRSTWIRYLKKNTNVSSQYNLTDQVESVHGKIEIRQSNVWYYC